MKEGFYKAFISCDKDIEVEAKLRGGVSKTLFDNIRSKFETYYSWECLPTYDIDKYYTKNGLCRRVSKTETIEKKALFTVHDGIIKVSVSSETPCDSIDNSWFLQMTRKKDRRSYTHRSERIPFRVDMTIVNGELYEIEVELTELAKHVSDKRVWSDVWWKFTLDLAKGIVNEEWFLPVHRFKLHNTAKFKKHLPLKIQTFAPFRRQHMLELNPRHYVLREKTQMFLMVVDGDVAFIAKNMSLFASYPQRSKELKDVTLIDGKMTKNGSYSYNALDILTYNGHDVSGKDLMSRLSILKKCIKAFDNYPLQVCMKDNLSDTLTIVHKGPYCSGYEWKPLKKITANFLLQADKTHYLLCGWDKGDRHITLKRKKEIFVNNTEFEQKFKTKDAKKFLWKKKVFVEARYNIDLGRWEFVCFKNIAHADHIYKIHLIMEQMAEQEITREEVLNKFN